jgi:hypothetical protein
MQNIHNISELKYAILLLEEQKAMKEKLLKDQLYLTYQSLKPSKILKGALKEVLSSSFPGDNLLGTVTGLATGYLSKKIVVGSSANLFRKLFGSIIGFGVTNVVSKNPEAIKSIGKFILHHIVHKKEKKSTSVDR